VTGTLKEVEEALDLTARGIVKPIVTKAKLSELDDIIHRLKDGKLLGRAVLQVAD
jgi:propanol-preferring alcohol dehydrogenase